MRAIGTWCYMAGLFAAANVVAAGVMLVTGRALQMLIPSPQATVPIMYLAGAAGVIAAVLFLRGAALNAPSLKNLYHRRSP